MSATVFGRMWRFCQMEDGVCKASLETIGEGIGVDKATIMRHAQKLGEAGYLKDLTPDLKNRPHVYADTGKAGLSVNISGVAQRNVKSKTVAENNVTVAQRNVTVAESQLNKDSKRDSKEIEEDGRSPKNLFSIYENEIGLLTPFIADAIEGWLKDGLPEKWIADGIHEAAAQNKRSWKYIEAILKRWDAQGNQNPVEKPSKATAKPQAAQDQKKAAIASWLAKKQAKAANG